MSNHECLCCDCMMNGLVLLFVFFFCTWPFGVLLLSVGTVVGKDLYYAVVLIAFVYPPLFVLLLCDVTSSAMLYPCMYLLSHSELSVQTHLPIRNIQISGFHFCTYIYISIQIYTRLSTTYRFTHTLSCTTSSTPSLLQSSLVRGKSTSGSINLPFPPSKLVSPLLTSTRLRCGSRLALSVLQSRKSCVHQLMAL